MPGGLAEALREIRGWQHTTLQIVCRPSGHYELVATADAITSLGWQGGGFQAVLDPDHRPAQPRFLAGGGYRRCCGRSHPAWIPFASPADLVPLTIAANLRRIHLNRCSRADVRDLTVLADLTELGYLSLTA